MGVAKWRSPPADEKEPGEGHALQEPWLFRLSGRAVVKAHTHSCPCDSTCNSLCFPSSKLRSQERPWFKRSHFLELDSACLTAFRTKQNCSLKVYEKEWSMSQTVQAQSLLPYIFQSPPDVLQLWANTSWECATPGAGALVDSLRIRTATIEGDSVLTTSSVTQTTLN